MTIHIKMSTHVAMTELHTQSVMSNYFYNIIKIREN